jgi:hypothetical protein
VRATWQGRQDAPLAVVPRAEEPQHQEKKNLSGPPEAFLSSEAFPRIGEGGLTQVDLEALEQLYRD